MKVEIRLLTDAGEVTHPLLLRYVEIAYEVAREVYGPFWERAVRDHLIWGEALPISPPEDLLEKATAEFKRRMG